MKRFFAWAGILIIAAVFLALIVLTFTGGPENVILALLFCVIVRSEEHTSELQSQ